MTFFSPRLLDTKNSYFSHFSTFPPCQPLFVTAKQPFITAHIRSSLHIFVHHHCTLKHALVNIS